MFGRRRASPPDPEAVDEARGHARQFILPGFLTRDEAHQAVHEVLEEDTSLDEAQIRAVVDEVWAERWAEQEAWQDEGDFGRVTSAFAELEAAGIVARMNFACCSNCGHSEIRDEARGTEIGYVFFHQQDAEHLADPDAVLYLAYGFLPSHPAIDQDAFAKALEGDEQVRAALAPALDDLETQIGGQVVAALERQGLSVEWDGDRSTRPAIRVTDWRKRLPA
jgi:hypothetical protein